MTRKTLSAIPLFTEDVPGQDNIQDKVIEDVTMDEGTPGALKEDDDDEDKTTRTGGTD